MLLKKQEIVLCPHPFCRSFWRSAAGEVKNLRSLLLAALMVAIRVALKSFYIPVGESLKVSFGFVFAAVGGSVYGPVLGFLGGVVSDLIGYLIAPSGAFHPIYTLIEAAAGLLYGLFTYRQKITFGRLLLTKASVNLLINILANSTANGILMGKGVYYYMVPAIFKNIVMLPFEVVLLALFFGALIHPITRMGLYHREQNALVLKPSSYVILGLVTALILAAAIFVALNYKEYRDAFRALVDSVFQR